MTKEEAAAVAELHNERSELDALLFNWLEATQIESEEADDVEDEPKIEALIASVTGELIGRYAFGRYGFHTDVNSPALKSALEAVGKFAGDRLRTVARERIIEIDAQLAELASPGDALMLPKAA